MSESLGEVAVVCEKKETFALGIEPADVEESRRILRARDRRWCRERADLFGSKQNRPAYAA